MSLLGESIVIVITILLRDTISMQGNEAAFCGRHHSISLSLMKGEQTF